MNTQQPTNNIFTNIKTAVEEHLSSENVYTYILWLMT